jgi:tetratricopeptide (TPR) repeat protein
MNNDEPILEELRKISAWADIQRKITKWSFISIAIIIPALIVFGVLMDRRLDKTLRDIGSEETPDWYDVDQSVRRGEFDKAIELGEKLIVKTPHYPEAHRRLAGACLAAGHLENARHHYAEAFRLFPTEENEKSLAAIDRRIKTEGR